MITKTAAIAGGVLGLILAFALFQLANTVYFLPKARQEGRELERVAQLKKSMELIERRSQTNAEIRNMDIPALCRSLGGSYVDGVCQ